jgi:hypothetical protein
MAFRAFCVNLWLNEGLRKRILAGFSFRIRLVDIEEKESD